METFIAVVVGAFAIGILVWLLRSSPAQDAAVSKENELIDPSDSRQIGLLIGLSGGSKKIQRQKDGASFFCHRIFLLNLMAGK